MFSQDTAAASHEIGEWQDDPFVDNSLPCLDNSILENGDPLVLDDLPTRSVPSPTIYRIWCLLTTSERPLESPSMAG